MGYISYMKLFLRILLIIALFSIPAFAQDSPPPPAPERIVYVATSGNGQRYHLENCRTLRNSRTAGITISDARQRGFTPCGVCKP